MKYMGMPWGMWTLFADSFQAQLTDVLGYNEQTAKAITRRAKAKYKEILSRLPEFEKGDRFKINLVGSEMCIRDSSTPSSFSTRLISRRAFSGCGTMCRAFDTITASKDLSA